MQKKIVRAQKLLGAKKSNPRKALQILRPILGKTKTPWQVHQLAGLAYFIQNDFNKAVKHLKLALSGGADNTEVDALLAKA